LLPLFQCEPWVCRTVLRSNSTAWVCRKCGGPPAAGRQATALQKRASRISGRSSL